MSQRLVHWALFSSEFNFKITYREGSANSKPDTLSRRPNYASNEELSSDIPFNVLKPENFCAATFIASLKVQISIIIYSLLNSTTTILSKNH